MVKLSLSDLVQRKFSSHVATENSHSLRIAALTEERTGTSYNFPYARSSASYLHGNPRGYGKQHHKRADHQSACATDSASPRPLSPQDGKPDACNPTLR